MLRVNNLSVRYAAGKLALDAVSFTIAEGQAIGLVGHSGSGKSTTALAILGMLPKSCEVRGAIYFRGSDLLTQPERELRMLRGASLSMVWQEPSAALNPAIKVGAQIGEVVRAHHPEWPRGRRKDAVLRVLDQVGLGEPRVRTAYPHQLSGGQLQRVVLAQALVCEPSLLLADEPAASLDRAAQASILELLNHLRRHVRMGMLFITHSEAQLAGLVDDVIRLKGGRVCY